jgi:hypothetical protein
MPSQDQLMQIRQSLRGRSYPSGALFHTMPIAKFVGTVWQGFVEPTRDFEGNFNVHVSRANRDGAPSGSALSYGRGDWPVVLVFKPGLATDLQGPGDVVLIDTPKLSDILEVYVRGQRYTTIRGAYELITKQRSETRIGEESEGVLKDDPLVKAGLIKLDDFMTGALSNPYWWAGYESTLYAGLRDDWDDDDPRVRAVRSDNPWRLYLNPQGMEDFEKAVTLVRRLAEKYNESAINFKYRVVSPLDKTLRVDPSEVSPIVVNFPSKEEAENFYAALSKMPEYRDIQGNFRGFK